MKNMKIIIGILLSLVLIGIPLYFEELPRWWYLILLLALVIPFFYKKSKII